MSSQREYRTTGTKYHVDAEIPWPVVPDGDGWVMCGSAAAMEAGWIRLIWSWVRKPEVKPCASCHAVAFTEDGKCVGCGTVSQ
jgi:hypothetical protein